MLVKRCRRNQNNTTRRIEGEEKNTIIHKSFCIKNKPIETMQEVAFRKCFKNMERHGIYHQSKIVDAVEETTMNRKKVSSSLVRDFKDGNAISLFHVYGEENLQSENSKDSARGECSILCGDSNSKLENITLLQALVTEK